MKAPYEGPTLRVHGDIRAITAGNASGNVVDQTFIIKAGDPLPDFTFSD